MRDIMRRADRRDGGLQGQVLRLCLRLGRDDAAHMAPARRRPLSQRSMRAPAVEITDIFGQDPLQMALIEDEHVVQTLCPDGSHPSPGYDVGQRRSERRARLGNTEITQPPIEADGIAAVAIVNKLTRSKKEAPALENRQGRGYW